MVAGNDIKIVLASYQIMCNYIIDSAIIISFFISPRMTVVSRTCHLISPLVLGKRYKLSSATIRDVANRAGVSIKTVSRVLNNEPFVKSTTKDKVLIAINELGYVASISARRLASGHSYSIGLIFHNASWHYTQDVLKGVIETARKSGYSTLLHPCDVCNDLEAKEVLNLVHQRVVDGLIFTPPADNPSEVIRELQQLQVPFVRLTPQNRTSPLPYVTATDMQGAFEMTNYLIDLGHRRIGFVLGPLDQRAGHDRFI